MKKGMVVNNSDDAASEGSGSGDGKGKGTHCGSDEPQSHSRVPKPKKCTGSLYYSSYRRSKSKNPICVGFSRTLKHNQFPPDTKRSAAELEASKVSERRANFKYACLGYSIYSDNRNSSADLQNKKPILPLCDGLEMLMIEETPSESPVDHVTTSAHKTDGIDLLDPEHDRATPQPPPIQKPSQVPATAGKEFFNRFTRNASLVASGVARNTIRVGNYAKRTLDKFLSSQRGGPK